MVQEGVKTGKPTRENLSDSDMRQNIYKLNKSRARRRYWREIGDGWVQTDLLPCDPISQASYLAKGFRLNHPDNEVAAASDGKIRCPFCAMEAEDAVSLKSHLTEHIKPGALEIPEEKESKVASGEDPDEEPGT